MPVTIVGNNTPTAGGVVYGDGTNYVSTAAGSSGGVLYSTGSGAPVFSAAGSAGQLLQSNGASAPSWATVASPAMVKISTITANNTSSNIDFTGLSGYTRYLALFDNLTGGSSASGARLTFGTGATPTYITANYQWSQDVVTSNTSTLTSASFGGSEIALGSLGSGTNKIIGYVYIFAGNGTFSAASFLSISTFPYYATTTGGVNNASALTAIRFTSSGGNYQAGSVTLYGLT